MCPYVGGSLTSFFDEGPQKATEDAARNIANRGAISIKDTAAEHTPVDTGNLRANWERIPAVPEAHGGNPAWRATVRNATSYAAAVEDGTGLYGPRHARITAKNGGVMRWIGKDGSVVFARSTKGMPGHHMLATGMNVTAGLVEGGGLFTAQLAAWTREVEARAQAGGMA